MRDGWLIFGFLLFGFFACMVGVSVGIRVLRKEAIEKGHAYYQVVDSSGNVQFQWGDKTSSDKWTKYPATEGK